MQTDKDVEKLKLKLKVAYWKDVASSLFILGGLYYMCHENLEIKKSYEQTCVGRYQVEACYDLLSMAGIWFALKMMNMDFIKRKIKNDVNEYYIWAYRRKTIIWLIICLGFILHFLFLCPTTLWFSLIGVIATFFVWPTNARWESETNIDDNKKKA